MNPARIEYIFDVVSKQLPQEGVDFLMIGGHAVNHYGYSRATVDVDFMITAHDVPAVREVMKEAGFSNVSESENVIFFGHPENPHRVDFLKIDRDSMQELMESAGQIDYCGFSLKVPGITDLIAMKLHALAHGSPQRREKNLPDILHLAAECSMDPESLHVLCDKYANDETFALLEQRMTEADDG